MLLSLDEDLFQEGDFVLNGSIGSVVGLPRVPGPVNFFLYIPLASLQGWWARNALLPSRFVVKTLLYSWRVFRRENRPFVLRSATSSNRLT